MSHLRPIRWSLTETPRIPWTATVDGQAWTVRIDVPPGPHLYSLLIDGVEVLELYDWPQVWTRVLPPVPFEAEAAEVVRVAREQLALTKDGGAFNAALKANSAAYLAKVVEADHATGKEPFDAEKVMPRFTSRTPEEIRAMYYVAHRELRTLAELVRLLPSLLVWDDD